MSAAPLASIIISSYNYGSFVGHAIESALNQTYRNTEVIVVDDGSTDNSGDIIASYGDRIIPILKDNGGQASALNAGFKSSRGEVILFMDSDDMLLPGAVAKAVELLHEPGVAKVHWPLLVIDRHGRETGRLIVASPPRGNLQEQVVNGGPFGYTWSYTTGNAWARRFIEQVFPIPEKEYQTSPDLYLCGLAPLYGIVESTAVPQGRWRKHGENSSYREPFDERLQINVWRENQCLQTLAEHCRALAIAVNWDEWKKNCWWNRIDLVMQDIKIGIPPGETLILVDEDEWATDEIIAGRRRIPFLERDGMYWGPPPDDDTALRELERLRRSGAGFIVFGWQAFWWLDYYSCFHRELGTRFRRILANDRCMIFDLR